MPGRSTFAQGSRRRERETKMTTMFTPDQLRDIVEPPSEKALRALEARDLPRLNALMTEMAGGQAGVESLGLHVLARFCGELREDLGEDEARALLDRVAGRMMESFAADWHQGRDETVIRDLVSVFRHQSGGNMVPVDETDAEVVFDLAPCGSGGRFIVDGSIETSPRWYGAWSDAVPSYCQACTACQRALNDAVGETVWSTEISERVPGRCTVRFAKGASRGQRLFEGKAFYEVTQTRIAMARQKVARHDYRVADLLKDQHRDWMPWHDFQIAMLAHVFGACQRLRGTDYLDAKLESAYNSAFRLFYPVFKKLDEEVHLRYLCTTHHYHMMRFQMTEEVDRFTFRLDPCGSGGRLYRGEMWRALFRYDDGPTSPLISEAQPITFGRRDFPVYCTHCAAHNRDQYRHDVLYFVNDGHAQDRPGAACLQFTYKKGVHADAVDPAIWRQVGISQDGISQDVDASAVGARPALDVKTTGERS